eukprot:2551065-Ditylum_brightwellii.AAC.1
MLHTIKTETHHYNQSSATHEGDPDSNPKTEETPPPPRLMKTAVLPFSPVHAQMKQIGDSSCLNSTTSDMSQILSKGSTHIPLIHHKAQKNLDSVLAAILLENQKNNQQMHQMMVLFNTTLNAMKHQNCLPPPSSSDNIERTLESIIDNIQCMWMACAMLRE